MMHWMTVINTAYCRYYVDVIWHMWNTRSNTVNQHIFTSSDHDDNTWCGNNIYSWLKEMYICQLSCWAFPPSTSSVCFTAYGSIVYLVHTHRRNRHHHHRKNCQDMFGSCSHLASHRSRSICGLYSTSIVIYDSFDEDNAGSIPGTFECLTYDLLWVS